jgi:putative transposase
MFGCARRPHVGARSLGLTVAQVRARSLGANLGHASLLPDHLDASVFRMTHGLKRFQQSGQSHFVTFACYHRRVGLDSAVLCDLFLEVLESMRRRFRLCIYAYVLMPDHVHLLLSEPERGLLADAIHYLKLSFSKRLLAQLRTIDSVAQVRARSFGANLDSSPALVPGIFWQKRYYDRNVRDEHEFIEKLRYIHRNPVRAGLCARSEDWKWSSFRHYAFQERGVVEIESEWTARDREKCATGRGERIFLNPG